MSKFSHLRCYPFFLCVVLIFVTMFFVCYSFRNKVPSISMNFSIVERGIAIGSAELVVEVADTSEKQAQGLSDRPKLSADRGMFFPATTGDRPAFWMKDMRFPLDFIYVKNGRVVEIKEDVAPAPIPVPFYPEESVDAVIEVNSGWVSAHGVMVGDPVKFGS